MTADTADAVVAADAVLADGAVLPDHAVAVAAGRIVWIGRADDARALIDSSTPTITCS
jgi:predicted amidohydrolase YtcJ